MVAPLARGPASYVDINGTFLSNENTPKNYIDINLNIHLDIKSNRCLLHLEAKGGLSYIIFPSKILS